MAQEVYIGFSTVGRTRPPYTMTDIELVKQDIMNTFQTRRGERVMRPNYGTIIYDLLMDPMDEITEEAVVEDVRNILRGEPRVEIVDIELRVMEEVLRIDVVLNFAPHNIVEKLFIEYDRRNQQEV